MAVCCGSSSNRMDCVPRPLTPQMEGKGPIALDKDRAEGYNEYKYA